MKVACGGYWDEKSRALPVRLMFPGGRAYAFSVLYGYLLLFSHASGMRRLDMS